MNEHKPTLLVTTSTFPRWCGDSEPRFVYDLSRRLTTDFNVIILAPHAAKAATKEEWDDMQIYRYRYAPEALETLAYAGGISANLKQSRWKVLLLPLFFLAQWQAIRRLVKHQHIDSIHAHWLIPQGLIAALALLGNKHAPSLVCTSHGGDLFGLQGKFSLLLKRWVISRCDALTVVSHAMLPKIQALTNESNRPPISVIPMGTDLTDTFIPNPHIARLSNRLLFVGRLVEKKGLRYLLEALQQLQPTHPNLELVIAGSGPLQTELMQQSQKLGIADKVQFVGRLTHIELVKLYQTATLAVFPFIQASDGDMEGLGLVMVEAMGCGCPVIASDLPAVRDVIQHGKTGHLVMAADSAALALSIKALLDNTMQQQPHSVQALAMVRHRFDWEIVAQHYQDCLQPKLCLAPSKEATYAN